MEDINLSAQENPVLSHLLSQLKIATSILVLSFILAYFCQIFPVTPSRHHSFLSSSPIITRVQEPLMIFVYLSCARRVSTMAGSSSGRNMCAPLFCSIEHEDYGGSGTQSDLAHSRRPGPLSQHAVGRCYHSGPCHISHLAFHHHESHKFWFSTSVNVDLPLLSRTYLRCYKASYRKTIHTECFGAFLDEPRLTESPSSYR